VPRLKFVSDDVASLVGESRKRRLGAAVGALGLVALTVGIVIGTSSGASKAASPASKVSGAATVQYRDLVATDTESGTLSYANPQTVYNRLSGTITWLPAVGAAIKPGGTLFDVDNAPVVLFDGSTPAYRDLDSSDTDGPDILELNRDLKHMGFDSGDQITVNDAWQTGTTDAVDTWQGSLGETETGTITLGQVVFLPGKQEVDATDTTLGSTGGSGGTAAADSGSDTSYIVGTSHPEFVSLTTTTGSTGATGATAAAGATGATGPVGAPVSSDASSSAQPSADTGVTETCNGLDVQQQTPGSTAQTTTTAQTSAFPGCNQKGATGATGTTGPRNPSTEAVLLALLKAETLELKKTLSSSGTGTGTGSGASGRGGSGTSVTTTTSGSGSGSRSVSGGGGGASTASASTGASAASASSGSGASSAGATADPILSTSATDVVVSVDLDATKQSEAKVGESVTVEMPAGNTINGKITGVSPIAQSSSSGSGSSSSSGSGAGSGSSSASATIPVTIALEDHHLPTTGLDQAAVSVNFQQQVENHVLSVPVTALLATAGGGYAVQEAASPHKLIAVTPGLFAAGYVQVSGSEIYSGLQVTDSQG
jgi:hypothetical protein